MTFNPYAVGGLTIWPEEENESKDTKRARQDAQNALNTIERMRDDRRNHDPRAYNQAITDFQALNQNLRKAQNQDTRNRYLAGLEAQKQEKANERAAENEAAALAEKGRVEQTYKQAYLSAGGIEKDWSKAWPGIWEKHLVEMTMSNAGAILGRSAGQYSRF
jgi:hypothetical protein